MIEEPNFDDDEPWLDDDKDQDEPQEPIEGTDEPLGEKQQCWYCSTLL
jgi:hypothetical protein